MSRETINDFFIVLYSAWGLVSPNQTGNSANFLCSVQVNSDGDGDAGEITNILTWHDDDVQLTQCHGCNMQQAHKYVTGSHRAYEAVRNELIQRLINFTENNRAHENCTSSFQPATLD